MRARLFTPSYCCILAANFLLYFAFWLLIPVFPFYLKEMYGLPAGAIGVILSCYTLTALLVRPFSGYLLDAFARKPLYLLAYACFTVLFAGYVAGGALVLFILLRTLHGLAFGTVTVGGNTLVVDIMPSERRGEGLGYYGLTNNLAMSIGPMVGLFLHGVLPYHWIFTLSLLASAIGFVAALCIHAPAKPRVQRPPISLDRFILLRGIPAGVALILLSIPYGATTNFVAMYASEIGLHVPTGFFFVLLAGGMGVSRIFAGKYVDKGYVTECIHYGFYLVTAAFLLLGCCRYLMPASSTLTAIVFFLVPALLGVGFGIMFPAYNSLYINLAPNNQRATATGTYLTSWDVGIGLGVVSGGMIAQQAGFHTVYLTGALLCLVSMLFFDHYVTPHYRRYRLR